MDTGGDGTVRNSTYNEPNCALYVGKISPQVTEKDLFDYFSFFPTTLISTNLTHVKLNVDLEKNSRCSGFLNFRNKGDAEQVYEQFKTPNLCGRSMVLNYCQEAVELRVFLYKIPVEVSSGDIIKVLEEKVGTITHSYFPNGARVATLAFEKATEAQKALMLGSINVNDHAVHIAEYKTKKERSKPKNASPRLRHGQMSPDLIFDSVDHSQRLRRGFKQGYDTKNTDFSRFASDYSQDFNLPQTIIVSEFPSNWTAHEISLIFMKYGTINKIEKYIRGDNVAEALVEYNNVNSAETAVAGMNRRVYNPWNVNVPVLGVDESEDVLRRFKEKKIESKPLRLSVK